MPTDDGQAAATVETSRADELSDMEHTMSLFADEYRARMNQADSLGSIAPIWVELTFEVLAGPFAREAAAQTIAAAVASGADPASIPQDAADRLARQHLTGFAMYGELLAAVVASAQQKALTAAGTDNDPALEIAAAGIGTAAAVDPYLTEQRLGVLAERTTVGLRNGATNLAMNTARTFLTATKADTLPLALQPPCLLYTSPSPRD